MAERVNRNVEWVTNDNNDVVGYQRRPGDVVPLGACPPRVPADLDDDVGVCVPC